MRHLGIAYLSSQFRNNACISFSIVEYQFQFPNHLTRYLVQYSTFIEINFSSDKLNPKMPDIFSYFSPKKLLPSPPLMVLTREVLIDTPEPPEEYKSLQEEEEIQKSEQRQNISEDEGDVAGILNENYEEDYCSTVENLSVALFKLETEKVSLDTEIRNKYNKMSLGEMEEIVEKIVSASGVDFNGDQEECEEVSEIFELLQSTAKFAKKRLRKIEEAFEKKQMEEFSYLKSNGEQVCVTDFDRNSLEEEVEIETVDNVIEFLTKSMSPDSLSKSLQRSGSCDDSIKDQEEQGDEYIARGDLFTEEFDFPDVGENENPVKPEVSDPELETRSRTESCASDDLAHGDNPKSPRSVKSRFGQVKNRLSLRRVFKKKSTSDNVKEDNH